MAPKDIQMEEVSLLLTCYCFFILSSSLKCESGTFITALSFVDSNALFSFLFRCNLKNQTVHILN